MMLNLKEYNALTNSFNLGCKLLNIDEKKQNRILKIKGNSQKENKMDFIIFFTELLNYFNSDVELSKLWIYTKNDKFGDTPYNLIDKNLNELIDFFINEKHKNNEK